MRHCTVCEAEAREGAKFCTSCGARLEAETPVEMSTPGPEPAATPTSVEASDGGTGAAADTVTTYTAPGAEDRADPEDSGTAATTGEEPVVASAPVTGDPYVASWPSDATEEDEPSAPDASTEEEAASDDTGPEPDADHHGASTWESWAPVASGGATIPAEDDALHGIREMVDQLKHRLDRLSQPVSLRERGVDPDALADDLGGWASGTPGTGEILDAIRSVRESPENVTALLRLASYADDLERIIEQQDAMTSAAERWVDRLREDA